MNKQVGKRLEGWLPYLQKEGLDGWFSSIENKAEVEVVIRMDPSVLNIVGCEPLRFAWKNANFARNGSLVPKDWGLEVYPISAQATPFQFHLNRRFQPMIEEYRQQMDKEDPGGTSFAMILDTAEVSYFDAPVKEVRW